MTQEPASPYPVNLSVDYPEEERNRLTTFFRLILAIPIRIIISLLVDNTSVVVLPTLLMILFRQKYPRWWFDWNLAVNKFGARIWAYLFLLRDEYPSTDEEQAVHLEIEYPNVPKDLNRWLPLVKWILAIPHYIILIVLSIAVIVCVIISWFAILFTGRYPRDLFDFVVGVECWNLRVGAYAFLLTTDQYPPFRLGE